MLANGITLGMKEGAASTYTNLAGLMEVPEMGMDPEKVDATTLADKAKQYEFGIGDYGDLEYTFKYVNTNSSSYRKLRAAADAKEVVSFEEKFPDGTTFHFTGQCNVKIGGGGVNGLITFTLSIALQSDITVTDSVA